MLGRDIRGYCKTEASTVFFRRKERLEDPLLGLGRDTTTFVIDFHTETISFEEAPDENYPTSGSGLALEIVVRRYGQPLHAAQE